MGKSDGERRGAALRSLVLNRRRLPKIQKTKHGQTNWVQTYPRYPQPGRVKSFKSVTVSLGSCAQEASHPSSLRGIPTARSKGVRRETPTHRPLGRRHYRPRTGYCVPGPCSATGQQQGPGHSSRLGAGLPEILARNESRRNLAGCGKLERPPRRAEPSGHRHLADVRKAMSHTSTSVLRTPGLPTAIPTARPISGATPTITFMSATATTTHGSPSSIGMATGSSPGPVRIGTRPASVAPQHAGRSGRQRVRGRPRKSASRRCCSTRPQTRRRINRRLRQRSGAMPIAPVRPGM